MSTPRYLTAQKISLLVLTRLYCIASLPDSATISILTFILSNSLAPTTSSARGQRLPLAYSQDGCAFSIDVFEDVLHEHASNMPGRTVLDLFLKHMWEVNSFDALHALFDGILDLMNAAHIENPNEEVFDRTCLAKTSPLGVFVRRAHMEFSRLQFDDSMKLWCSFIAYRAPTAQWTKRLAGLASSGVDAVISEMGLGPGDDVYEYGYGYLSEQKTEGESASLDDLDRCLEFQLSRLQRFGERVPETMKAQLQSMLSSSSMAHRQAHLVQFFDAWKAGDYTTSFESLHRYYDYAIQTREKIHYQYALLHMAILQADFGCFGEAISAINETIATARENQDMTCLSFSLSWLNHMARAYPKQMRGVGYMSMLGNERDGLTFLKTKAKEMRMYSLLSASLLNESKFLLATGDSIPRALEYVYQSSHLNIRENINTYGSQMLLTSTFYSRLGSPHVASAHCGLLLDCYIRSCSMDERVRAVVRQAFITSANGQYTEAITTLMGMEPSVRTSLKLRQHIYICAALARFRKAVRRANWQTCAHLMLSIQPPENTTYDPMDPELSFLQHEAFFEYLVARGSFSKAHDVVTALTRALTKDNADILQRVSTLLMKAELFRKIGEPERGFSVALRAASVSHKARLMPSLWASVGLLGNILNSLGEFTNARRLVASVLPQALEGADNMLTGTLYSHLADSYMGLAGLPSTSRSSNVSDRVISPNSSLMQAANVARADVLVDRAMQHFKKCAYLSGECEQLMKKAIIAKTRGDEKLAEEWAQNHNRVWEEAMRGIDDEV